MNDLSVCKPVCTYVRRSVGLSSALWKNGGSDPDAIWHPRSDGSRDEADSGVWGSVHGKGYFWGANLGRAIVTNGDFTAFKVCDSTATRPSSQITLGRLVNRLILPARMHLFYVTETYFPASILDYDSQLPS